MNKNEAAAERARKQVESAAEQFIKSTNGRKPRIKDIREACPGMSDTTISKYLKHALEMNALLLASPEEVTFSAKLQEAIKEEIEDRTISECKRLTEELQVMKDNYDAVLAENLRLQEEYSFLKQSNEQMIQASFVERGRIVQLEKDIEEATRKSEQAQSVAEVDRANAVEAAFRQKEAEEKLAAMPELQDKIASERLLAEVLRNILTRDDRLSEQMVDVVTSISDIRKAIHPKGREKSSQASASPG